MVMGFIGNLGRVSEIPIIQSTLAMTTKREQIKFPRSKKKRICKKWRKNSKNYKSWYVPAVYAFRDAFVVHPDIIDKLMEKVNGKLDEEVIKAVMNKEE